MITEPGTVWISDSGVHHDSRTCAGQDAVPAFEEWLAGAGTEPCGLCEPNELLACDDCGEPYRSEGHVVRHRTTKHLADNAETDDTVERHRELDAKARGESDD